VAGPAIVLYTDGASRGNPGLAGAGILVTAADGTELAARAVFLGECTNNAAEYQALLLGLEAALPLAPGKLTIRMDSELIVRQLNGQYRVKSPDLLPLYQRAVAFLRQFKVVQVEHVRREFNSRADRLANQAIDEAI
jgi:ribonuclease HI